MAKEQNKQTNGRAGNNGQAGSNADVEMMEQGEIFFLYRPAVEEAEVNGLEDVQRFFLLLHPEGSRNQRLLIIGRKRLPEADKSGERYWGFVDAVLTTDKELKDQFAAESYETETRGDRLLPSMRPAGMGQYQLLRHGNHTHLAYELTLPERRSEVQQELNIERAATYVISVKNPDASTPQGVGLEDDQKAALPNHLQEQFKGRRFINADPPDFLDHQGVEFLLISTDESVASLGIDVDAQRYAADADANYVFEALRMQPTAEKERTLLSGKWQ